MTCLRPQVAHAPPRRSRRRVPIPLRSGYHGVENNVVYNIHSGCLMYSDGGHEHVIRNNVFAFPAHHMLWPFWEKRPNAFRREFAEWQAMGLDRRSVIADPRFVNAAEYDFRLQPGSPALGIGFQPIDASRVGLYGDPAWVEEARRVTHPKTVLPPSPPPPQPREVAEGFVSTAAADTAFYLDNLEIKRILP